MVTHLTSFCSEMKPLPLLHCACGHKLYHEIDNDGNAAADPRNSRW
jgi:hypothetical protein